VRDERQPRLESLTLLRGRLNVLLPPVALAWSHPM